MEKGSEWRAWCILNGRILLTGRDVRPRGLASASRSIFSGLGLEWNEAKAEAQSGLIVRPNRAKMYNSLLESLVFLKCNLALWTGNWWTGNFHYYCSCLDSFICCSVLLAFFNYITKICHIITTVVNAPIPVHLSASTSASMVRPRPQTLWPRPRRLGLGLGLVMSGLVNIPGNKATEQSICSEIMKWWKL